MYYFSAKYKKLEKLVSNALRIIVFIGKQSAWLNLFLVLIICFDVLQRYLFNQSYNWILETEYLLLLLPVRHHLDEIFVKPAVAGQFGVEGCDQPMAYLRGDRRAVGQIGDDVGVAAGLQQARAADEHGGERLTVEFADL